jgi:2-methylisocitrate lyase-like PEP mutase family enzyme
MADAFLGAGPGYVDIGLDVEEIAALGVRRISVGGALALAAWTGFIRAATTLRSDGSFAGLADLVPFADINEFFGKNCAKPMAGV